MTAPPGAVTLGDPTRPLRVHVVGIGGAGMSAIATALHAMGHTVTGSDVKASGVTDRLRRAGIEVAIGHTGANVGPAEVVAVSSAVASGNPEITEARRRGCHRAGPIGDPGRHRLAPSMHRRGRHPREDHHGIDAGPPAGGGRDQALIPHRR